MARTRKYDWPDDQKLQALLDEHGAVETARHIGCPPASLSRRIRQRGLRKPRQGQTPDAVSRNGKPDATNPNGSPDAANPNGSPDAANPNGRPEAANGNGKPDPAGGSEEPSREPKPSEEPVRRGMRRPIEQLGSADYMVRRKPASPAGVRPQEDQAEEVETGADPSFSAQPAPRPKRRGAALPRRLLSVLGRVLSAPWRALSALRRVPAAIWRLLAVLALAAIAGIAAFLSVSNDPKTYERESSYAVRPSSTVPPAAVNDVLGTLAQPDSAITETIVNMLGSPRLRSFAAQSAGLPASSVGGSGAEYVWSATRRPGSTIIDVRLTGPDDDKLLAMQTAATPEAARLVEGSYPPYRLETLNAPSPPVQVGPKVTRTVGLALLLGATLGIILVLAERRLRSSLGQRDGPAGAPAQRGDSWER